MDIPYRKFFFAWVILGSLFACALPNFAALAPTPASQAPTLPPETAHSDDDDNGDGDSNESESQAASLSAVPIPPALKPIDQLPAAPTISPESSTVPAKPIQIEVGLDYQITGPATVRYTAAGNRPFVVRLSSPAGVATIRNANGIKLEDIEIRKTATKSFYIVPTPFGATYDLDLMGLDPEINKSMTVRIFDLTLGTNNVSSTSEFVGIEDLIRTELNMAPNLLYVVILQPSAELDAVMELYDTAGIVTANDAGGAGEPETFFVSSSAVAEWAIVTYSYLDSAGDFTLDVYEIP